MFELCPGVLIDMDQVEAVYGDIIVMKCGVIIYFENSGGEVEEMS